MKSNHGGGSSALQLFHLRGTKNSQYRRGEREFTVTMEDAFVPYRSNALGRTFIS